MHRFPTIAAAVVFALLGSSTWAADADSPMKYSVVHVTKVEIAADMDRDNPDEVKYYRDLEEEATAQLKSWFSGEGYRVAENADPADPKQATITTKAVFNAGNQAVRWVAGIFGAGKASAKVTMEATESSSGKKLFSKEAEDTMRVGGFGGNASRFFLGVIDAAWNEAIHGLKGVQN